MRHMFSRRAAAAAAAVAAAGLASVAPTGGAAPPARFSTYAHTGLRLADVVWTGNGLLYVENTTNTVWRAGTPPTLFATMPKLTEETRCRRSPGAHGFPPGDLYCHAPDNTLYRIGPAGTVSVFARLPEQAVSDGALAFDDVGRFGFRLLAATGRSGAGPDSGGAVYAVSAAGRARLVGRYAGDAGGADEIAVAPARFGAASGQAVLTLDAGKGAGALLAMDASGRTRTIARLPDGPNPIVVVPARLSHGRLAVPRGLYVADTNSTDVFFAPAAAFPPGALVVGTELGAQFWAVRPRGDGFRTWRLPLTVPGSNFNLEGAVFVG